MGECALYVLTECNNQVVADGGLAETTQREYDWSDCGKAVEPAEWHETVDAPDTIVLDCRNEFESEVRNCVCVCMYVYLSSILTDDNALPHTTTNLFINGLTTDPDPDIPPPKN